MHLPLLQMQPLEVVLKVTGCSMSGFLSGKLPYVIYSMYGMKHPSVTEVNLFTEVQFWPVLEIS